MIKNATGNCFWRYDADDEYRMSLVARHDDGSEEVLIHFRTFEQEKFLSVAVMFGERQHLWGKWRALAEREGHQALEKVLSSLKVTDYLENFVDVTIEGKSGESGPVMMSVHLLPTRQVDVIRHVFQTPQHHRAFLGWAEKASLGRRVGLCLVGLLEGKKALAVKMNSIADAELSFGQTIMDAMMTALEEGRDEVFIPGNRLSR